MERSVSVIELLRRIATVDLMAELGRRANLKYGKLLMTFHAGRPTEVANLDMRVSVADLKPRQDNDPE